MGRKSNWRKPKEIQWTIRKRFMDSGSAIVGKLVHFYFISSGDKEEKEVVDREIVQGEVICR